MPYWIRKIFPPKTIEVQHIVGLPGLNNVTKRKVAALIYYTDELLENQDVFVDWCAKVGADDLRHTYSDNTFKGF
jgi:hypothetical protein